MKLKLKDFQEDAVNHLVKQLRMAARESGIGIQAVVLSSPTGSGKTMIATASIERIIQGDGEYAPDSDATFLWLSDQPEINEQTRRKMIETSSLLDNSRLLLVDSTFDHDVFLPGRVYFLNIQKLGKEKQLVTHSDERTFTIWETITNTVRSRPEHFYVFIDEAHRGMSASARDKQVATTIVQKFIRGSEGEIPPVPVVVGISATPERFDNFIKETDRVSRPVPVPAEAVRASGLLKDTIKLFYPSEKQPTDMTMLFAAAQSWREFTHHWLNYCRSQGEKAVQPILMVQVQDGTQNHISNTDIGEAIDCINATAGPFPSEAFAHSFQEGCEVDLGSHKVRYLGPADISADPNVKVVFFKTSLNTGWDCPRAEVMMSFRKAVDATLIAQLVGRMVRTPLARRISSDEFLNSVALYLPHYDEQGLHRVIDKLTTPDAEIMPPVDVEKGADLVTLSRSEKSDTMFEALAKIPSYVIPRSRRMTGVKRLMKLARLLANDDVRIGAVDDASAEMLSILKSEYSRLSKTSVFKRIVESKGKVKIRSVDWQLTGELTAGETVELDIAKENLDDIFDAAGRKLGEGLHKAWWRDRVEQNEELRTKAKLEAVALAINPEVLSKLERTAQVIVREWLEEYQQAINGLPEVRIQQYIEVRQLASQPEIVSIVYPGTIEVRKGSQLLSKHLYVDEKGEFPANLNNWETAVVSGELGNASGWLRNFDRKSWSLTIPYESGGEFRPLYPDFLIVRNTTNGFTIDLLDPHHLDLADAPAKAAGLAKYAAAHAHLFGRIELIIIRSGQIRRLNLKDEATRNKVRAVVTREHLQQIYEG